MLNPFKDNSKQGILFTFYKKERDKEGFGGSEELVSLSDSWSKGIETLKIGDRFKEDFLVLSIQPFDRFFDRISFLTPLEVLDSKHQKDYDLGILLEHKEGFKVLGIIKYRKFRLWSVIPEIGSRYKFSGFMERWINGIRGNEFVCWGCRLEGIKN